MLLVEDDAAIQRFVRLALRDLPLSLTAVATLAEARRAWSEGPFDLLLTDQLLPDGQGLDLLAQWCPGVGGGRRAVLFTAGATEALRAQALAVGAWSVLDKPASLAALRTCVQRALAATPAPAAAPPTGSGEPRTAAIEAHFGGQAALFDAFRAASLQQFGADIQAGDAACGRADAPALLRLGHSLKTVLQLIGATEAAQVARALEHAAAGPAGADVLAMHWLALRSAVLALD